jgi:phosphoribosylaminoimidazole-succinocarboxamide synthase
MTVPIVPVHSGKVRDTYEIDNQHYLIVASDRLSVFDVVLGQSVPGKGKVLTAVTDFWLDKFFTDIPSHYVMTDMSSLPPYLRKAIPDIDGRGMIVRKAEVLPIEVIVRNYLYGSVMKEYEKHGTACGIPLPANLVKASKLPEPIFTPSTKAKVGHDQNITKAGAREELIREGFDPDLIEEVEKMAIFLFKQAGVYTERLGIITADTKFEFGLIDGVLSVVDEVLTPDSSRYWELESWEPGKEPVSLDKQPVRNYYKTYHPEWVKNATSPAPDLPDWVVADTSTRYRQIQDMLTI